MQEKLLSYIIIAQESGETLEEATTVCISLGGSVALPLDDEENNALVKLVSK